MLINTEKQYWDNFLTKYNCRETDNPVLYNGVTEYTRQIIENKTEQQL